MHPHTSTDAHVVPEQHQLTWWARSMMSAHVLGARSHMSRMRICGQLGSSKREVVRP